MKFSYPTVDTITCDLRGLYRISHDAYHVGPGISSSRLKKALISHASYISEDKIDSAALTFGRAFHAALIEPNVFAQEWTVLPEFEGHPNSNAYKSTRFEWLKENQGKQVLDRESNATIISMLGTVKSHPEYAGIAGHSAEIMGVTQCLDTGFLIKCKCDLLGHNIVDFKTTSSGITKSEFMYDVVKWRYHVSAAFYQDIISSIVGYKLPFWIIPVTKKAPFECEFYELSDDLLEEGRKLYKAALRRIKRWETVKPAGDKKLRMLQPNSRMINETREIIEFIEN